jgi:FkbM family methyltransferase
MLVKDDNHKEDISLLLAELGPEFPKSGVLHIGAHVGEEVDAYLKMGFETVYLVEANPESCRAMEGKFKDMSRLRIFNYAVSDSNGYADLHMHTSRRGSTEPASILQMKRLKEIVTTLSTPAAIRVEAITLDSFVQRHRISSDGISLMNIDIQGAELMALRGGRNLLSHLQALIVEVALIELYDGAPLEMDIVEFLSQHNFERVKAIYHSLYDENSTFPAWGECLFLRKEISS